MGFLDFFKKLLDYNQDGKITFEDFFGNAMLAAKMYGSTDPRAKAAIVATTLLFNTNDKLQDEALSQEEKFAIIQNFIEEIKNIN